MLEAYEDLFVELKKVDKLCFVAVVNAIAVLTR